MDGASTTARSISPRMSQGRPGPAGAAKGAVAPPRAETVAGPEELQALRGWLCGARPLPPEQALRLLDRALAGHWLQAEPALQWRAVKARVAGESNWADMGFRLALH